MTITYLNGFPTAATTGVPAGTVLTPLKANLKISKPGTVIDNVEINGSGVSLVGLQGASFTATGLNIYGTGDGAHLGGGATIQDSYIHDLARQANLHHDDLQTVAGTKGSNIQVLNNTLLGKFTPGTGNSVYHLGAGPVSNVTVAGNYMDGGQVTIQVDNSASQHNIGIHANYFGRDDRFGLINTGLGKAVTFTGNFWADTGLPIN